MGDESLCGVVVNVLVSDIVVNEFELRSHVHLQTRSLRKGMNVFSEYHICKDVKWPTKVDMTLNKENQTGTDVMVNELGSLIITSEFDSQRVPYSSCRFASIRQSF